MAIRLVPSKFWTDPFIRRLSARDKVTGLFYLTSPLSHTSGIYLAPPAVTSAYLGCGIEEVRESTANLEHVGKFLRFDQETWTVWVFCMYGIQGRGDKLERSASNQLKELPYGILIEEFLGAHPSVAPHYFNDPSLWIKNYPMGEARVYLLSSSRASKVGVSINPSTRSRQVSCPLTGQSPQLVAQTSFIKEPFKLEALLHDKLLESKVEGEWFLKKPALEVFRTLESEYGISVEWSTVEEVSN